MVVYFVFKIVNVYSIQFFFGRDKTLQDRQFLKTKGSYLNIILQSETINITRAKHTPNIN